LVLNSADSRYRLNIVSVDSRNSLVVDGLSLDSLVVDGLYVLYSLVVEGLSIHVPNSLGNLIVQSLVLLTVYGKLGSSVGLASVSLSQRQLRAAVGKGGICLSHGDLLGSQNLSPEGLLTQLQLGLGSRNSQKTDNDLKNYNLF